MTISQGKDLEKMMGWPPMFPRRVRNLARAWARNATLLGRTPECSGRMDAQELPLRPAMNGTLEQ